MNLKNKRKDIILFIITVIILSFLTSCLSNIVFESLFEKNKLIFTIATTISLIILVASTYFFILANKENGKTTVVFVYTFNKKNISFYDVENCVPSVHARFLFDRIPIKKRQYLADYDGFDNFFSSEFCKFINSVTQEIILGRVIKNSINHSSDYVKILVNELPLNIKNNLIPIEDELLPLEINIPRNMTIESFGTDEEFIRLKSKYGKIEFSWSIVFHQLCAYSKPFIAVSNIPNKDAQHDFSVKVTMRYECFLRKIFSREVKEFTEFVDDLSEKLDEYDWKRCLEYLPVYVMQEIAYSLNSDKEKLKKTD